MRGAGRLPSFSRSCGPPPHHPADLYISRRVSHFRHYHSCRGSVRARHTRPAVLPAEFTRRPEAVHSFSSARIFASPSCVATLRHCISPRPTKWCGCYPVASPSARESICCGFALPLRIETGGVQPLLRVGVREGLHGTCVPRGPKRRIHLLPLLSSGIR